MHNRLARQRGMSLISLMVALTIGTFLLAGLFQIWYQTRQTFTSQGQLAQLEDNERMALTTMANTVGTGGFYPVYLNYPVAPNPPYTADNAFPTDGTTFKVSAGQFLYGTHDGTVAGETLTVRFQADKTATAYANPTLDCLGQTEATGTVVINTYSIKNNQLGCTVTAGATVGTWQPIINGSVNKMTVYYGVDTLGDGTALEYLTADQVSNLSAWMRVFSVKVVLTFNNPLSSQKGQSATLPTISRVITITHLQTT